MAKVTFYEHTGFSATNLPDSEAVLENRGTMAYSQYDIDVIQTYGLTSLSVSVFNDSVPAEWDYCKLENGTETAYYAVIGYIMTSSDVARVDIVMDPFLSAVSHRTAGVSEIVIKNGAIVRSTVLDDFIGEPYIEGRDDQCYITDPYLSITRPYTIRAGIVSFNSPDERNNKAFVALSAIPKSFDGTDQPYRVVDLPNGEQTITNNIGLERPSITWIEIRGKRGTSSDPIRYPCRGYGLYDLDDDTTQTYIHRLWAIGAQQAILGTLVIPDDYWVNSSKQGPWISELAVERVDNSTIISQVKASIIPNANAQQSKTSEYIKRYAVLRAPGVKIGVMSTVTAQKIEYQIASGGDTVSAFPDVHMGGAPIFCYPPRGMNAGADTSVLAYSITGGPWAEQPIVNMGSAGYAKQQAALSFNQSNGDKLMERQIETAQQLRVMDQTVGAISNVMGQAVTGNDAGVVAAIAGGVANLAMGEYRADIQNKLTRERRAAEKAQELMQYHAANTLVAPTVSGSYIADMQDIFGNTVIVYGINPSDEDKDMWGRICCDFGVKCYVPVAGKQRKLFRGDDKNDLPWRYIQTAGAVVSFDVPKADPQGNIVNRAVISDMAAALDNGVRFWSVCPADYKGDET